MSSTPVSDVEAERDNATGEAEEAPVEGNKKSQPVDRDQIRFQFCREW